VIRTIGLMALLLAPGSALAGMTVSVDMGAAFHDVYEYDLGLRAGYTITLVNVHLTPEISERLLVAEDDLALGTFFGARASIGFAVAPGVYFSTGAWTYDQTTSTSGGVTLDFRAIPLMVVGAHGGYTLHDKGDFPSAGVHAGIEF